MLNEISKNGRFLLEKNQHLPLTPSLPYSLTPSFKAESDRPGVTPRENNDIMNSSDRYPQDTTTTRSREVQTMNRPRYLNTTTMITAAACAISTICMLVSPANLRADELSERVAEGVDFFRDGDFASAAAAFDQAGVIDPDDPRVVFDRGCAYTFEGKFEDAIDQFQKAATAEDALLASRAQYNLGCLNVRQAEALLGEDPMVSTPEVRTQTVERLEAAITRFRDALIAQPDHADAKFNLESVRLWLARMEKEWKAADLKAELEEQEVLDMVRKIDGSQRKLRAKCKELETARRSIFRRQEIFNKEQEQRELAMQIDPLKAKIEALTGGEQATADPTGQAAPQNSNQQFDQQEAVKQLIGLADNSVLEMNTAADRLAEAKPGEAVDIQTEAIDRLDFIYTTLAPYEQLVKHAIDVQGRLLQGSQAVVGPTASEDSTEPTTSTPTDTTLPPADTSAIDWDDSAVDQRFVARYAEVIRLKAEQMLAKLPPPPAPSEEEPETSDPSADTEAPLAVPTDPLPSPDEAPAAPGLLPGDVDPGAPIDPNATTEPPVDPEEQARKQQEQQIEALRVALTNAVENCPQVAELAQRSSQSLSQQDAAAAVTPQEVALRLLEEMLPKNPNQDQQDQEQQEQNQDSCNDNQCKNPGDQSEQKENQSENQDGDKPQDSDNQDQQQEGQPQDEPKDDSQDEPQDEPQDSQTDPENQNDEESQDPQNDQGQGEDSQDEQDQAQQPDQSENEDESGQNADQQPEGDIPEPEDIEQATGRPGEPTKAERKKVEELMLRVEARQKERDRIKAFILQQQYRPDQVEKDW